MDFEGIYCFDTASVRFAFYPDGDDGARILGLISEQTLRDVCGARDGSGESLLATCRSHFSLIRDKARQRPHLCKGPAAETDKPAARPAGASATR